MACGVWQDYVSFVKGEKEVAIYVSIIIFGLLFVFFLFLLPIGENKNFYVSLGMVSLILITTILPVIYLGFLATKEMYNYLKEKGTVTK